MNFVIQAASIDTTTRSNWSALFVWFPTSPSEHEGHPARKDAFDSRRFDNSGLTRRIVLPVTHLGTARDLSGNRKLGFEGETTVNRKDYGLNWNAVLASGGFVVGNEVKVSLSIQAA